MYHNPGTGKFSSPCPTPETPTPCITSTASPAVCHWTFIGGDGQSLLRVNKSYNAFCPVHQAGCALGDNPVCLHHIKHPVTAPSGAVRPVPTQMCTSTLWHQNLRQNPYRSYIPICFGKGPSEDGDSHRPCETVFLYPSS